MTDKPQAKLNWSSMSDDDRIAFTMWVVGLLLLPIALPLYIARQLLKRVRHRLGQAD